MSEVKGEYPKLCEFCGEKIGTRIDLDWHGLGNCVPVDQRLYTSIELEQRIAEARRNEGNLWNRLPNTYEWRKNRLKLLRDEANRAKAEGARKGESK